MSKKVVILHRGFVRACVVTETVGITFEIL